MITTSVKIDVEKRGATLTESQRAVVERLRNQGFELQRRFETAEMTALLLEEMLDPNSGIEAAINNTFEARAFVELRLQLFRILVVDIHSCVLDTSGGAGSVAAILKEIKSKSTSFDSLKAYYADPACLVVEVESDILSVEQIDAERGRAIQQSVEDTRHLIDVQFKSIQNRASATVSGIEAERMKWARHQLVAHFQRSTNGIVALDNDPPCGSGKLTWTEPVKFIEFVRPFVYDVFHLVTSTSWALNYLDINRFYARAFWDRMKNGTTSLRYSGNAADAL